MKTLAFKRFLRTNQTEAETALWRFLRAKRLNKFKFRRQVAVGPYVVDFMCCKNKLIIEIDGGQHNEIIAQAYDVTRSKYLNAKGFTIIRFWNDEVLTQKEEVLNKILDFLDPSPSESGDSSTSPAQAGRGD